jgi:hypothetical protein
LTLRIGTSSRHNKRPNNGRRAKDTNEDPTLEIGYGLSWCLKNSHRVHHKFSSTGIGLVGRPCSVGERTILQPTNSLLSLKIHGLSWLSGILGCHLYLPLIYVSNLEDSRSKFHCYRRTICETQPPISLSCRTVPEIVE